MIYRKDMIFQDILIFYNSTPNTIDFVHFKLFLVIKNILILFYYYFHIHWEKIKLV